MTAEPPRTITFAVEGPIERSDLPGLCARIAALFEAGRPEVALCDVCGVEPNAVTVDALARLQLAAQRFGCQVRLRGASRELLDLVAFMGLENVLPADSLPGNNFSTKKEEQMASATPRTIFVNLAVEDLDRSVEFFKQLGFTFDPRFTDESATCMVVSGEAYVMLLVQNRFKDFTKKELADPRAQTEAIVALSASSRDDVDELADKALAAGGSPANDPIDIDFMYSRSFQDPDGHIWELVWMDPSALGENS